VTSSNVVNPVPFLRTSREYPEDIRQLTVETNKAYVDTAAAVNSRTIGIFPTGNPAITGESWFLTANQKQQTVRQVFTFTSTTAINHGINIIDPNQFTDKTEGSYTDGTNSYGLIFGTTVAVAGLLTFYISPTQIVFVLRAGAPTLKAGRITLEWLSQP
jgi:hypothetical protein